MKIITLHQPWASLVALGLKRYETRHWSADYRGKLLIHAAKRSVNGGGLRVWLDAHRLANIEPTKYQDLPLGSIVAIADLTKCLKMWQLQNLHGICINDQTELERLLGLWEPGRFAFRLDNVRPLPKPIPFKSRQGKLLDAPTEIIALVNEQFQEVA